MLPPVAATTFYRLFSGDARRPRKRGRARRAKGKAGAWWLHLLTYFLRYFCGINIEVMVPQPPGVLAPSSRPSSTVPQRRTASADWYASTALCPLNIHCISQHRNDVSKDGIIILSLWGSDGDPMRQPGGGSIVPARSGMNPHTAPPAASEMVASSEVMPSSEQMMSTLSGKSLYRSVKFLN